MEVKEYNIKKNKYNLKNNKDKKQNINSLKKSKKYIIKFDYLCSS